MTEKRAKMFRITEEKIRNQFLFLLLIFLLPFIGVYFDWQNKKEIVNDFNSNKKLVCTVSKNKIDVQKENNWIYEDNYFIKDDLKILFSNCSKKD
jgi:hypothetical protein